MPLKNTGNENLKIGDIVKIWEGSPFEDRYQQIGIVLETDIDMWGEEVTPSGVQVQWPDGDMDVLYSDEIFSVNGPD